MENKKKPAKIIVCSGIKGQVTSFVDHLEGLYAKKGSFDYVFCIGDFFGDDEASEKEWEEFKKSGKKISVPVYILGPNQKQHEKYFNNLQNNELAPNIYYLGKDGVFSTSDGLKIGYISGLQSEVNTNEIHTFNYESISQFRDSCVRSGITLLDMLLTSPWPLDVRNKERIPINQNVKLPSDKRSESQLLSWVDINLTPRYHFASMQGVFYQRSPYKNKNSNTVTRFIGLGDYHDISPKKQKWMYGFILSPADLAPANKINYTVTESPFDANQSYYSDSLLTISKQYFYQTSSNSNFNREEPFKKKKMNSPAVMQRLDVDTESCWFCLSSKNITKHMIVSIGDRIYLAGTKGPLVKEHLLIAPIDHYKSFAYLPRDTENEINLIKRSINEYFESTGRLAVYFERNILSAHFQIQVVPVSKRMCDRLEHMFKLKFGEYDLKLVDIPPASSLRQITGNVAQYFYVELPNGKRLFHNGDLKPNQRFPLHIAREVLASPNLLNAENRIDWRTCMQTLEEEEADINYFRSAFARFNPIKD